MNLQNIEEQSWRYTHHGSDTTLIWFGGISEPLMNPAFLEARGVNLLNVRDMNSDWFTSGSLGFVDSFEALVGWIHAFLVERGSRYPIFAGQSSGGYAALRAANMIKPCLVIAFAPQTASRPGPSGDPQPPLPIPSLDLEYQSHPPEFPIVLHLSRSENQHKCEFFWDDWAQISILRELPNVTLMVHPCDMHAVTLYLLAQGRFYDTIVSDMQLYANPRVTIR